MQWGLTFFIKTIYNNEIREEALLALLLTSLFPPLVDVDILVVVLKCIPFLVTSKRISVELKAGTLLELTVYGGLAYRLA